MLCTTREIQAAELKADCLYRVAFPSALLWRFSETAKMAPRNFRCTDLSVDEALERFLGAPGSSPSPDDPGAAAPQPKVAPALDDLRRTGRL